MNHDIARSIRDYVPKITTNLIMQQNNLNANDVMTSKERLYNM